MFPTPPKKNYHSFLYAAKYLLLINPFLKLFRVVEPSPNGVSIEDSSFEGVDCL